MNLIETGHHQVNAHCDPDLGAHGVVTGAVEGFDSEVLLDPFEEKFDLPAALVDGCNRQRRKFEIVGQKNQAFVRFGVDEADSPESFRVVAFAFVGVQFYDLIASETGGGIHLSGFSHSKASIGFAPYDEEGIGCVDLEKTPEVEVSPVENVDASPFEGHLVKEVDIVHRSVCNADKHGDWAGQIDLGMQLDRGFGFAKGGPREHGQTQVDGRGINGINHLIKVETVRVANVQASGFANQNLGKCLIDPPVPEFVGIRKIGTRNVAANTHRVKMLVAMQTRFDIAQSLPKSDLGKCHRQELIACGHASARPGHRVASNATGQLLRIQNIHDLSENESAGVHFLIENEAPPGAPAHSNAGHSDYSINCQP